MTKQEQEIIDKCIKKISKLKGEVRSEKGGDGQQLWVWVKKGDVFGLMNAMVKELKELQ
jgi:hypothetical protein